MIHIDAPHFNAGGTVKGGVIIDAAPIIKYMIGWTVERAVTYCRRKNWSVEVSNVHV